ncbi:Sec-independent protein translocase protein TatB [Kaarinaea lacus]
MFDVGFLEIAVIGVVALLVIGPEKLPAVARTVGYWFGKARRFAVSVQEDLNREVSKSEELKRLVEEQSKIKEMHEIIEHTIDDARKTVSVTAQIPKHEPQPMPSEDSSSQQQEKRSQATINATTATNNASQKRASAAATKSAESVDEQSK